MSKDSKKEKPILKEGLSKMIGRLIMFLAGKGPAYRKAKEKLTDPAYRKKLNNMHKKLDDLLKDFEEISNA